RARSRTSRRRSSSSRTRRSRLSSTTSGASGSATMYDLVDTTLLLLRRGSRVAALALIFVVGATMAPWVVLAALGIPPAFVALGFLVGYLVVIPAALATTLAAHTRALEEPPGLLETLRRAAELVFWLAPTTLYALVPSTFIPIGVYYAFHVLSHEKI